MENQFDVAIRDGTVQLKDLSVKGEDLTGRSFNKLLIDSCNMSDTLLDNTVFSTVTFIHTTMGNCRGNGAKFAECRSLSQSWYRAFLQKSCFSETRMERATFGFVHLVDCLFDNCEFVESSFSDEKFQDVVFQNCRFERVGFENGSGCKFVSCAFHGMSFEFANFAETSFEKSVFENCVLVDTDCTDANFCGADLRGMSFELEDAEPPDLSGAKFDATTRFPDGFDPEERGMVKVD